MDMQTRYKFLGFTTLYKKEVRRFLKVYNQTLVAPMVNALLFLSVFTLAMGERVTHIGSVPFQEFLVAGLVMMTIVQNAFSNTSSAFVFSKVVGSVVDYQIPPLSPRVIMAAMLLAGITRGAISGAVVLLATSIFVPLGVENLMLAVFFVIVASMMLALLGVIAGILAEGFDQLSAITSYIITPLSFLSGTFYSAKNLPEFWQFVNQFNPFFYMIDGFRYAMIGYNDASIWVASCVLIVSNLVLFYAAYRMLASGYRIKQ